MSDGPLLTEGALAYACQRVSDFALVNVNRDEAGKVEAINTWLTGVGLDERLKAQFGVWLENFLGPGWDGSVLIGLAVGLFVNQFTHDHP